MTMLEFLFMWNLILTSAYITFLWRYNRAEELTDKALNRILDWMKAISADILKLKEDK